MLELTPREYAIYKMLYNKLDREVTLAAIRQHLDERGLLPLNPKVRTPRSLAEREAFDHVAARHRALERSIVVTIKYLTAKLTGEYKIERVSGTGRGNKGVYQMSEI